MLATGYLVGVGLLGLLLLPFRQAVTPWLDGEQRAAIVVTALVGLGLGDLVAVWRDHLYPLSVRRQAIQVLAYRWRSERSVKFVWGLDAGFGIGTYRVTSGLWVLAVAVLVGVVSPWVTLLYGVGFGLGFLTFVLWPVRVGAGEQASTAVARRVGRFARRRRIGQIAYVAVVPVAVAAVVVGTWG